jgi:hypothetical protein
MTLHDRAITIWDEPEYIVNVERLLNTYSDYENGISPQELTTGSPSLYYYTSLFAKDKPIPSNEYLQSLNTFLSIAHAQSQQFHNRLIERRKARGAKVFYEYTPGELVLAKVNRRTIDNKLKVMLKGPYRVINSDRGNVECEHLAKAHLVNPVFHISRLTPYTGRNDRSALEMAMRDEEQFITVSINGYRGEPSTGRMYMTFLVQYNDGDLCWVQYNNDLKSNITFSRYIETIPELVAITFSRSDWIKKVKEMDKLPMTVPNEFYLDLRALGFTWYDSLGLENSDIVTYRIKAITEKDNARAKSANIRIPDLNNEIMRGLKSSWFFVYARVVELNETFILVDKDFVKRHIKIHKNETLEQVAPPSVTEPAIAGTYPERRGLKQKRRVSFSELEKVNKRERVSKGKENKKTNETVGNTRVLRSNRNTTQMLVLNDPRLNGNRDNANDQDMEEESEEQRNSSCTSFSYVIPSACTCILGTRGCLLHSNNLGASVNDVANALISLRRGTVRTTGRHEVSNNNVAVSGNNNNLESDDELAEINRLWLTERRNSMSTSNGRNVIRGNDSLSPLSPLDFRSDGNEISLVRPRVITDIRFPTTSTSAAHRPCECRQCLQRQQRLYRFAPIGVLNFMSNVTEEDDNNINTNENE